MPTYLANLGGMLIAIEDTGGQPSSLLTDGADIQRLVAERHGAQRARLGWSEDAVRQEYRLLAEELRRVIRRHARAVSQTAVDEGLTILMRAVEQGEESSIRGLQRTRLAENDEAARMAPNSSIAALDASVSPRG
ncbi:MAG: hypothetical protein DMD26_01775 [Gemmatimonadetes bacterium]|nr:MAG: hypothetical protein DMD26_01775 [Gemmatimonadota bacterium]